MKYSHLARLAQCHRFVLGSGSPRRQRLLKETGIPFEQIIPQLAESRLAGESPYPFARRLAECKALWVSEQAGPDAVVVGCDTIVVQGETVLGKPADPDEAFATLSSLVGLQHVVCTALAFVRDSRLLELEHELTSVFFNRVTPERIREYIASGEPMDKAGAYGIQGMGAFLVDSLEGNLDNVIGLPRILLDDLARKVLDNL